MPDEVHRLQRSVSREHAVVTGAGTGIGRAIAQRLAAEGARLTVLARDEERLRDVVPGATTRSVDIRDRDAVFAAFDEPLDILVANAGIGGENVPGPADRWDDIVTTNLSGTYWGCRAAEPLLADGGRIVVTSSILARIGVAGYTAYCASRRGCSAWCALWPELAPRAIQVNAVSPGWVSTDMALGGPVELAGTSADGHERSRYESAAARRMGEPRRSPPPLRGSPPATRSASPGRRSDHNNGAWADEVVRPTQVLRFDACWSATTCEEALPSSSAPSR